MAENARENAIEDTLILSLAGEIPLGTFATSMRHFTALVDQLSSTIASKAKIRWMIEDLSAGSASATVIGVAEDRYAVTQVVEAYLVIGQSLARGMPIPYSEKVKKEAVAITDLLNGHVKSIRFETPRRGFTVSRQYLEGLATPQPVYAHGALKGTVETISRRRGYTFTLYDALFDKAVTCRLAPTDADIMRDAWGKKVLVFGYIGRDPQTGVPIDIRHITHVEKLSDVEPGSYRQARGIYSSFRNNEHPEDKVRRVRDV